MKKKIILDLCGGTGSWSRPYKEAGYSVILITLPQYDIRLTEITDDFITFRSPHFSGNSCVVRKKSIKGILAAPPCTMFSLARTNAKKERDLHEGMECVKACLDIIYSCQEIKQSKNSKVTNLDWWALENPYHGLLKRIIGNPSFVFDPYEFGDMYKKKTALWGYFKEPKKKQFSELPKMVKFDKLSTKEIHPEYYGKYDRTVRRSITPAGFANAFYKANK